MKFVKRIRQQIRCFFNTHEMSIVDVNEYIPPSVEYQCQHCNFKSISYFHDEVYKARKIKADFYKEHITTRFVLFEKDRIYTRLNFSKSLQYIAANLENKRIMEKKEVDRLL